MKLTYLHAVEGGGGGALAVTSAGGDIGLLLRGAGAAAAAAAGRVYNTHQVEEHLTVGARCMKK